MEIYLSLLRFSFSHPTTQDFLWETPLQSGSRDFEEARFETDIEAKNGVDLLILSRWTTRIREVGDPSSDKNLLSHSLIDLSCCDY